MKFLSSVFFYFCLVNSVHSKNEVQPLSKEKSTSCYFLRLRDIPVSLQKTAKSNEFYLQAKVHDRLIVKFTKACDRRTNCVIYNHLKNTSKTLTTDQDDIDYYVEATSRGQVRCANSNGEFLLFNLIVAREDDRFFTEMSIQNGQYGFLVQCLGGYYSKDVRLKINGKPIQTEYDPLYGFNISTDYALHNTFFQCEKIGKNNDQRSLTYRTNVVGSKVLESFSMKKQDYYHQSELQCIIERNVSSPWTEYQVILACSNQFSCPALILKKITDSTKVYVATVSKSTLIGDSPYSCVFLTQNEVVAQVYMDKIQKFPQQFIGYGFSSNVFEVPLKNGKKVVLKRPKHSSQCAWELKMLELMKHPNIVTVLGEASVPIAESCWPFGVKHLMLPYYKNTSLDNFIVQFHKMGYQIDGKQTYFYNIDKTQKIYHYELIFIGLQIAEALVYLSSLKITHRDVAMRNVLITDNLICKLIDFERAKKGETKKISVIEKWEGKFKKNKKIPMSIYPIEACQGYYYYQSEVFSFGYLLLNIFRFENCSSSSFDTHHIFLQKTPLRPFNCLSTKVYDLIVDCMKYDWKLRPTIHVCQKVLEDCAKNECFDKFKQLKENLNRDGEKDINYHLAEQNNYPEVPDNMALLLGD